MIAQEVMMIGFNKDDEGVVFVCLTYDNITFKLDTEIYAKCINSGFTINENLYNCSHSDSNISLFDFIINKKYDDPTVRITFIDGDDKNWRLKNIVFDKWFEKQLKTEFNNVEYIGGHIPHTGRLANTLVNPIWKTDDRYIMFIYPNHRAILDDYSIERIRYYENMQKGSISWNINKDGYIFGSLRRTLSSNYVSMHRLIMDCWQPNSGEKNMSIDHINRIRYDNRRTNLRIATKYEQSMNRKGVIPGTKYERKYNAQPLPPGITQDMLIKYIGYYTEEYETKGGIKKREFFRIEKHPNQCGHEFNTSKSNKVSITEKLEEAKRIVAELDKRKISDVNEVKPKKEVEENYTLPQYFHMTKQHGKDAVCFERRYNGKRVSLKVTIKKDETIQQAVERIIQQVDIETGEKKTTPKEVGGVTLSKGFSFSKSDGKDCISFQRNISGKRYVGKTIIGEGETIADTIERLKTNIKKRYELEDNILFSG